MPEPSPLLRLPAEVRNTIYELVVAPGGEAIIFEYTAIVNPHTSLTAANRQLRREYLPIFQSVLGRMQRIEAKAHDLELDGLRCFIDDLPPVQPGGVARARTVDVTFVSTEPGTAMVNNRILQQWAKHAAGRRRKGRAHAMYKVDVSHCGLHTWIAVKAMSESIARLANATSDPQAALELGRICRVWWKAGERREDELTQQRMSPYL